MTAPVSKYTWPDAKAAAPAAAPTSTTVDHTHDAAVPIVTSVSMLTAPWRACLTVERWNGHAE